MLDFLGIGAQKAGTTYLYERLAQNKRIVFPAGKEIHFWNNDYQKNIEAYQALFSDDQPECKKGEITPAYALLPADVIKDIHAQYPKLRLIYIIRNPIDRAWSAALMALTRAEMKPDEASDRWFIDHFRSHGSLERGDYEKCIRSWSRFYPIEQILILNFNQLESDPKNLLESCFKHIGLESFEETQNDALYQPVFKGLGLSIRPSLLPHLCELYEKKIESLSTFLNQDFSSWIDQYR